MSNTLVQPSVQAIIDFFRQAVQQPQSVLLALGKQPTYDQWAAALGMAEVFRDAGLEVRVAAVEAAPELDIPTSLPIVTDIGNENLVVSFDYDENAVDKVSYHIGEETQRFYLTIKPKKGYDPLDVKDVQYDYTGSHADVVITFGVVSFEELEQLFAGYEEMYQKAMVVAFCPTEWEGPTHCVVAENDGEHSALAAHIIQKLELHVSMDAASALTAGIQVGTNSLQNEYVSPEFYEIMAYLLRQGADKKPVGEYRVLAQKNSRKKLKTVSLR